MPSSLSLWFLVSDSITTSLKKIHIGPDPAPTEIKGEIPINFSGAGSDQVFFEDKDAFCVMSLRTRKDA